MNAESHFSSLRAYGRVAIEDIVKVDGPAVDEIFAGRRPCTATGLCQRGVVWGNFSRGHPLRDHCRQFREDIQGIPVYQLHPAWSWGHWIENK
jgi:hypothetical protein